MTVYAFSSFKTYQIGAEKGEASDVALEVSSIDNQTKPTANLWDFNSTWAADRFLISLLGEILEKSLQKWKAQVIEVQMAPRVIPAAATLVRMWTHRFLVVSVD